ncbi:MAG: DUF167 domain-containing protein [Ktedonobacteraceae bacterium]
MLISVKVIPRSSKNSIEWEEGSLKIRLTAPPVDGLANEALVALLAERLALSKRSITIVRGATSRQKTVEITGMTMEDVEKRLKLPPGVAQ